MRTSAPRCGAIYTNDRIEWCVWAPKAQRVDLLLANHPPTEMQRDSAGYFHTHRQAGNYRYAFSLDNGPPRADPCSLWQPDGPSQFSATFNPAVFRWSDAGWGGIGREDLVFYELHVAAFTPEGTFDAIIPRLAALRELGITAIELMPISQFSGSRNWGYDGVLHYAAQNNYGGPAALQRLIDAAHAKGMAIFLDVVYNHFGPEHNYLSDFGPYFTDGHHTPWGWAVNFDGPGSAAVRRYVLDNVRMWLEDFHFDGVRLDAIHAIYDNTQRHILGEIATVARDIEKRTGRTLHVVAESGSNDPVVVPREMGGHALDAQWADDFHHAVHVLLTGERRGYYGKYTATDVAKTMHNPLLLNSKEGTTDNISGEKFIACIQNHDQIGNRPRGDRLTTQVANPAKMRLAACLLLFAPYTPLLFMGEEYAEKRPFPFFCSFEGSDLIEAVRKGRREEFAAFMKNAREMPDPQSPETFASAVLTWAWPQGSHHAQTRRLYADLLQARRTSTPLRDFIDRETALNADASVLTLLRGKNAATIYFNLTAQPQPLPQARTAPPAFSSEFTLYGGKHSRLEPVTSLLPFECIAYSI